MLIYKHGRFVGFRWLLWASCAPVPSTVRPDLRESMFGNYTRQCTGRCQSMTVNQVLNSDIKMGDGFTV